ncbi:MAG: hypothetical protein WCC94_02995 [Candidatus Bathyarchaeia archaeon]
MAFVTIGLSGGLLDYVEAWASEDLANKDADRIARMYGIDPKGKNSWHDDDSDVYVNEIQLEPERMTSEEWGFFTNCWLEGMKKVRLSDSWDSNDESQRLLNEVDRKLLKLKPLQVKAA